MTRLFTEVLGVLSYHINITVSLTIYLINNAMVLFSLCSVKGEWEARRKEETIQSKKEIGKKIDFRDSYNPPGMSQKWTHDHSILCYRDICIDGQKKGSQARK